MELAEANRQADYIRRVHYLPEYAKELRTTNISDVLFKRFITATQNGVKVIEKHGLKCAVYRLFVDAVCTRMGYYLVILFAAFRILVLKNMMVGDGLMVVMAMFSVTEALLEQEKLCAYRKEQQCVNPTGGRYGLNMERKALCGDVITG